MKLALGLALVLTGCATAAVTPEESQVRALLWDAATECARASSTITITDVDYYGRVHYSLSQGGRQDVAAWEACYRERTQAAFAQRPELVKYYQDKMAPR